MLFQKESATVPRRTWTRRDTQWQPGGVVGREDLAWVLCCAVTVAQEYVDTVIIVVTIIVVVVVAVVVAVKVMVVMMVVSGRTARTREEASFKV